MCRSGTSPRAPRRSQAAATSGGGLVDDGSSVTVVATPNAGYTFTNWTEAGAPVSAAASYTFTATADRTLVANFTAVPTYTVATSAAPAGRRHDDGRRLVSQRRERDRHGDGECGLRLHRMDRRRHAGEHLAELHFHRHREQDARRELRRRGHAARPSPPARIRVAGGTTSGGGNYVTGDSATVVATANPGYEFSKWQEGGTDCRARSRELHLHRREQPHAGREIQPGLRHHRVRIARRRRHDGDGQPDLQDRRQRARRGRSRRRATASPTGRKTASS